MFGQHMHTCCTQNHNAHDCMHKVCLPCTVSNCRVTAVIDDDEWLLTRQKAILSSVQ